jgi:cytochrome c2
MTTSDAVCSGMAVYILLSTSVAGVAGVHAAFGPQFTLLGVVSLFLLTVVLLDLSRPLRTHAFIVAFIVSGAVTIVIGTTREHEAVGVNTSNRSPSAVVGAESTRAQAAGEKLFQELGCIRCHRPDGKGIGPALVGVFGRPATDPSCGMLTIDEEYVREAILNPSATVALGFAPVMPTFAGKVTEDELRALVMYVKSLSLSTQGSRRPKG